MVNWYVDNSVSVSGNGTSWTSAWKEFTNINWSSVYAGDTIYISGGITSQTYNDTLIVGASGSVGNPITIKMGQDDGHNGNVIITSTRGVVLGIGIHINSKNYIIISGQVGNGSSRKMRITGGNWHGINIEGTADNLRFEYLEVDNNGNSANHAGIWIAHNTQPISLEFRFMTIHDNYQDAFTMGCFDISSVPFGWDYIKIHDSDIYHVHDDMFEGACGGVSIYNNNLGTLTYDARTPPERGHPDLVQFYGKYYKFYNNFITGWSCPTCSPRGGSAGIYYQPSQSDVPPWFYDPGYFYIYNNIFYEPNYYGSAMPLISFGLSGPITSIPEIKILNNTIVGWTYVFAISNNNTTVPNSAASIIIENNIFWDLAGASIDLALTPGDPHKFGSHGDNAAVIFDYNVINPSTFVMGTNGIEYNYNNFKVTDCYYPCQDHEVTSNPNLDNKQRPTINSTSIIDKGIGYNNLFTYDKDGIYRPQGSAWDIGAYEYISGECPTPIVSFMINII